MLQLVFNYYYLHMLILLDLLPNFLIIPIHFSNIFKYFYNSYSNHPPHCTVIDLFSVNL